MKKQKIGDNKNSHNWFFFTPFNLLPIQEKDHPCEMVFLVISLSIEHL